MGIIQVDLKLLNDLNLLNNAELEHSISDDQLNHYFHIIETPEEGYPLQRAVCHLDRPAARREAPTTTTFISLLQNNKPHLEIVYLTSGVYPQVHLKGIAALPGRGSRHRGGHLLNWEEAIIIGNALHH